LALVIMFAIYAFTDAGLQTMRAQSSRTADPVLGHRLLAVVGLGAGLFALVWPPPTAYVLVIVVASWARSAARPSSSPVSGFSQITAGIQFRQVGAGAEPLSDLRDRV
jgi:hypothetical protein